MRGDILAACQETLGEYDGQTTLHQLYYLEVNIDV